MTNGDTATSTTDRAELGDALDLEPLTLPSSMSQDTDAQGQDTTTASPPSADAKGPAPTRPKLSREAMRRPSVVTISGVLSRTGTLHRIPAHRRGSLENPQQDGGAQFLRALGRSSSFSVGDSGFFSGSQSPSTVSASPDLSHTPWTTLVDGDRSAPQTPGTSTGHRGKQHTGSALEAFGALFLGKDSAGSLDTLSLSRASKQSGVRRPSSSVLWWVRLLEARRAALRWLGMEPQPIRDDKDGGKDHPTAKSPHRPAPQWGVQLLEEDETPPTPVAMPGAYVHDESDILLLPPPLLDDESDPFSFEGVLGVRRMREQQARQKRLDLLHERNRPAHRVGLLTAFSNFVKAAKASEMRQKQMRRRALSTSGVLRQRRSLPNLVSERSQASWFPASMFGQPAQAKAPDGGKHEAEKKPFTAMERRSSWQGPNRPVPRRLKSEVPLASEWPLDEEPESDETDEEATDERHDTNLPAPSPAPCHDTTQEAEAPKNAAAPPDPTSLRDSAQQASAAPSPAISATSKTHTPSSGSLSSQVGTPGQHGARLTPRAMLAKFQSDTSSPSPLSDVQRSSWQPQERPAAHQLSKSVAADEPQQVLPDMRFSLSYMYFAVTLLPDFVVFLLAHVVDFLMEAYEWLAQALWLLKWIWLNVTGRTVLGQCAIEAYRLIQGEWAVVSREDHEMRGERRHNLHVLRQRKGLSTVQVVRGLLELVCLQTVTRDRYVREGAGLVRLENWQRVREAPTPPLTSAPPESARVSGKPQEQDEDDDDDSDLLVTDHTDDILEISRGNDRQTPLANSLWQEDNVSLVRNIKWASRLAISAYGLQVLIVDLPPVFTPSGRQFPQQTFAHLSRLSADDVLHAEIQTLDDEAAYSPTFYIVRDLARKVVCVAVRGTQSFADIVVDLELQTEDVTDSLAEWQGDEGPGKNGSENRLAYHAGIWRAARALVAPESTLRRKLALALQEHEDFGVVFVGHSLGGAIASAAAILLSEYHLPPQSDGSDPDPLRGEWRTHGKGGFPRGRRIRAITFAHPSTLSHALAKRTSLGAVPLVTSLIYGSDIVSRFGHGQVRELRRVLGALARVRRRRAMISTTISSNPDHMVEQESAVVHVLRRTWDWVSICRARDPDAVMLDRKRRIEREFWRLRCEVEDDLFARAKARHDEAHAEQLRQLITSPWLSAQPDPSVPLHKLSTRRQRLDMATLSNEATMGGPLVPAGRVLWLAHDGELYEVKSPPSFFSFPDFQVCIEAHSASRSPTADHVCRPLPRRLRGGYLSDGPTGHTSIGEPARSDT